jgi:hypothetical protein
MIDAVILIAAQTITTPASVKITVDTGVEERSCAS